VSNVSNESNVSNVSVVVGQVSEDRATANVPLRCFEISSKMQWPKLHTAREHGREGERQVQSEPKPGFPPGEGKRGRKLPSRFSTSP
jgi:hypothetical protein